jgi:hypothetical protein
VRRCAATIGLNQQKRPAAHDDWLYQTAAFGRYPSVYSHLLQHQWPKAYHISRLKAYTERHEVASFEGSWEIWGIDNVAHGE